MCELRNAASLRLTAGFSLPIFSIVGRQMGVSVTRKGVFDHSEAWVHYEEFKRRRWGWGRGGEAGRGNSRAEACQICRLLLGLIWRGAQEMIKAQVKSLIELSFRLISLLPLWQKALSPPSCCLRGGAPEPAAPKMWHLGWWDSTLSSPLHIDILYIVFNRCCMAVHSNNIILLIVSFVS